MVMAALPVVLLCMSRFSPPVPFGTRSPRPSTANCTENFITQHLDHFSFTNDATFQQRYYTYEKYYSNEKGGPVFFYTGNEADVGLYVNATGLIWENAEKFGAYIVFAEHRFYGASKPSNINLEGIANKPYAYLSHELALADYAILIETLRAQVPGLEKSAFIAFGGSYGGKMAAWLRMKYPGSVAGAISASAPLLAFRGERPGWNTEAYYEIVTNTAKFYSPSSFLLEPLT